MSPVQQSLEFNPEANEDSVRALTLVLRGLRLGGRVRMPDGTLVVSRSVRVGPHQHRRFTIVPADALSSPQARHRALVLGHASSSFSSAEEAAKSALGK